MVPPAFEPEIWSMRHPLSSPGRTNWRLIALLIAVLTLGVAGVLYRSDEAPTAAALGAGWSCTANLLGAVCVRDVTATAAQQ